MALHYTFDFTVFWYKWMHFMDIDGQDHFLSPVHEHACVRAYKLNRRWFARKYGSTRLRFLI